MLKLNGSVFPEAGEGAPRLKKDPGTGEGDRMERAEPRI